MTTADPLVTVPVGAAGDIAANSTTLLATARSFELTVVVVPVTTKLPPITVLLSVTGISSAVNLRNDVVPEVAFGDARK